jgi:exodeoxyribonuclease-3
MNIRLLSWNINSVRLRIDALKSVIKQFKPNIVCLQETKCPNELFPFKDIEKSGLSNIHVNGIKGYHGVCIATDLPVAKVEQKDFCGKHDGRHIYLQLKIKNDLFNIHNFYVPAGGDEPDPKINEKFKHKLGFLDEATAYIKTKENCSYTALVGDLNIAPHENDVWSHKQLLKIVSHTPVEVEKLNKFQDSINFIDALREFHPLSEKLYSWWSYRSKNWEKSDRGRRLDHIWITPKLNKKITKASIQKDVRGWDRPSDHSPLIADFKF